MASGGTSGVEVQFRKAWLEEATEPSGEALSGMLRAGSPQRTTRQTCSGFSTPPSPSSPPPLEAVTSQKTVKIW